MATRINNRGFHFGVKSQAQAVSIVNAHPNCVFDITDKHGNEFVADQYSALQCIEALDSDVNITMY